MLAHLKIVIKKLTQAGNGAAITQDEIRLASVMLLVEVMMADHHIDDREKQQLLSSTMALLQISREQGVEFIDQAVQQHDDLVSLYDVTRVINQHLDQDKKIELIVHMWRIAYSDRQWDMYEEYLIRKVADLLYISHKDFIHARLQAQEKVSGSI